MKTIFKGKSGRTSSKRILSFAFGCAAIALAFVYIFSDNIAHERRQGVSNIIITFALISCGNQALATSKFESKNDGTDIKA